ncbi:MAG: dihydroorotase [Cyanobium sp.]
MTPAATVLLRQVHVLEGPDLPVRQADVLLAGRRLQTIAPPASAAAGDSDAQVIDAAGLWLAPALVDPHSVLRDPRLGRAETLHSLAAAARAGGYGTVALLPWAGSWRDHPETLDLAWPDPQRLLLWGAFSQGGEDLELAPHADLLAAGACGLACGPATPGLALLERGLRLGEMASSPVLIAPRDPALSREGFVRERVEALRAGWPVDPPLSEILPLQGLLTLAAALPEPALRLMNISTAEAVDLLRALPSPPQASVSWWHLLADCGSLDPAAEGWRLQPPLGGPADREALIAALAEGVLSAVAVHHEALDAEERLLPLDQRRAGIAGHGLVLPLLWQELVVRRGWSVPQLWQALCWGPCRFVGIEPSTLRAGGQDWILFDPSASTGFGGGDPSLAANRPDALGPAGCGRVVASGFSGPEGWQLPGPPSP